MWPLWPLPGQLGSPPEVSEVEAILTRAHGKHLEVLQSPEEEKRYSLSSAWGLSGPWRQFDNKTYAFLSSSVYQETGDFGGFWQ